MKASFENDKLWALLGQMPQAEVSPWFTTRVIARVKSLESEEDSWFIPFKKLLAPLGATSGLAAVIITAFFLFTPTQTKTTALIESEAEVFAALDSFLDVRTLSHTLWSGN